MENPEADSLKRRSPPLPPSPPQQQQEPEPKRPKMSSTTSDDDAAASTIPRKPKYKRRKIAIFFAYCGVGYQGMQKNPGAKTIEGDLEEALFHAGAVPEADRGCPKWFDWARSARTDKGVSAVGQVVSGRFYIDPPGLVERLNSILPDQIRIFGFNRVTPSFNAKKFCDRRRYMYLIPVFALDPSCHRDRESVMASLGSGTELVKCVECSNRGRKVDGLMGKRSYELRGSMDYGKEGSLDANSVLDDKSNCNAAENGVSSNIEGTTNSVNAKEVDASEANCSSSHNEVLISNVVDEKSNMDVVEEVHAINIGSLDANTVVDDKSNPNAAENGVSSNIEGTTNSVSVKEVDTSEANGGSSNNAVISNTIDEKSNPVVVEEVHAINTSSCNEETNLSMVSNEDIIGNGANGVEEGSVFKYGDKEKERFNRILNYYVGTHNFHNFTTRITSSDPAAQRYIISFDASKTVTVEGIEFVKCEVVGQSFMLHQIRKMMGLAVAVMRNCSPESLIEKALQKDVKITVPTAPEVGLYLDECIFSSYNQKWKETHEGISMEPYADQAEEFKMKYIYPHVASTEHKEGIVALWLHSLNHRNYSDLRAGDDDVAGKSADDGNEGLTLNSAGDDVAGKSADVEATVE